MADDRLRFLADRMAILLVICRLKYGIGWSVWLSEGLYTDDTGDEFRAMPEYKTAMQIVRRMLRRKNALDKKSERSKQNSQQA